LRSDNSTMKKTIRYFKDYLSEYQSTFKLALPLIVAQGGQVVTGIADNLMVGNYDTTQLAASAFANSIFTIFLVLGIGFAYGITPLVGTAYGKKDFTETSKLLSNGLFINVVFALVLAIVLTKTSFVLHHFDQEPEVAQKAIPYYNILNMSLIPLLAYFAFKQFAEGTTHTKPGMVLTLIGNLLNIILNYVLIFGHWGFPEMGLEGAGWATFWARTFMAVAMGIYIVKHSSFRMYLPNFSFWYIDKRTSKTLLWLGIPIAIQFVLEVASFNAGTIMVGWLGKISLAAHQIAMSLVSLLFMTASGFSQAATIRISNLVGENDVKGIKRSFRACFHLVIGYMSVVVIIVLFFARQIAAWHSPDQEVIRIATHLIVVACCFEIFDAIQVVCVGALRGIGDVKTPSWVAFLAYWAIALPIGYWVTFTLAWGAIGIWIGFLVGLVFAAIVLFLRFENKRKKALLVLAEV